MIRPEFFIEKLRENGIDCFAGVPDSLLKNICACITDHCDAEHNIIAAWLHLLLKKFITFTYCC